MKSQIPEFWNWPYFVIWILGIAPSPLSMVPSPMGMSPSPMSFQDQAPVPSPLGAGAGSGAQMPQPSPPPGQQTGGLVFPHKMNPASSSPSMMNMSNTSNPASSTSGGGMTQQQQPSPLGGGLIPSSTTAAISQQTFKMPSTTGAQALQQVSGINTQCHSHATFVQTRDINSRKWVWWQLSDEMDVHVRLFGFNIRHNIRMGKCQLSVCDNRLVAKSWHFLYAIHIVAPYCRKSHFLCKNTTRRRAKNLEMRKSMTSPL